jgi:RNA polymerase sigma-70 factor (ECF subfamily)
MAEPDFTLVCDRHLERIYGFFAYALSSRPDAEDLTQQTFERAMRAWGGYDASRASASTWLLAIARNLLIDHLRAAGTVRTLPDDQLEGVPAPPDRPSLGLDPDLEGALAQLAPREREVIALRFGGDLSSGEIAGLTGLTAVNVQQITSRSLRRMRAALDSQPVGAAS